MNTKYFHRIAPHKRKKNIIASIVIDNYITKDPDKIKRHIRCSLKGFKSIHTRCSMIQLWNRVSLNFRMRYSDVFGTSFFRLRDFLSMKKIINKF
jgi:hypothetical protein